MEALLRNRWRINLSKCSILKRRCNPPQLLRLHRRGSPTHRRSRVMRHCSSPRSQHSHSNRRSIIRTSRIYQRQFPFRRRTALP